MYVLAAYLILKKYYFFQTILTFLNRTKCTFKTEILDTSNTKEHIEESFFSSSINSLIRRASLLRSSSAAFSAAIKLSSRFDAVEWMGLKN